MQVVNILDTEIFWAIGKPPNSSYQTLREIITSESNSSLQLPRPIYRELGGDPEAETIPSGSEYVDHGIRAGWIDVAAPISETPPVSDAVRDARAVMNAEIDHPKTAVVDADLSLIGLAIQLFDRAKSIHVNLFTTDKPLQKAATIVIQYYGYYDLDVYFAPPQHVSSKLIQYDHFTAGYHTDSPENGTLP
jgi:hypothetical protein